MTHYEVLRVKPDATDDEIKSAYKKLAKQYHPDVHDGDPKYAQVRMTQINASYSVLRDNASREEYDYTLWKAGETKAVQKPRNPDEYWYYATRNSRANPKSSAPPKPNSDPNIFKKKYKKEKVTLFDLFMMFIEFLERGIYHPKVKKAVIGFFKIIWKLRILIITILIAAIIFFLVNLYMDVIGELG